MCKNISLSKRLKKIADCVEKCELAADIGTDHAHIPVYLVKNNIADKCIASDVSKASAQKAQINVSINKLDSRISVRCGNGLECLGEKEIPECVIIAGMGGLLISKILKNQKTYERLVLQPQRDAFIVRKDVHKLGYKITNEYMIYENKKYYNIIVCRKGCEPAYTEEEYRFGKILLDEKNELLVSFLRNKILKFSNIERNFSLPEQKLEEIKIYKAVYEKMTAP